MKLRNRNIALDANRILDLKEENISEVSSVLQPTKEIKRMCDLIKTTNASTTGTMTVALPSDKDCYITNIEASYIKNAACDVATGVLTVSLPTLGSSAYSIIQLPVITLTAQQEIVSIQFEHPIKCARGLNAAMTGAFTAGVMVRTLAVQGYTEESTKTGL